MKTALVCAAIALATPPFAASVPASASQEVVDSSPQEQVESDAEPANESKTDTADDKTASKADEKRICRRVRLDVSSRRATKVCRTKDEWRELNQPR